MQDHASKTKGLIWLLAACALGVFFALGLSPLAHAVPWSWEKKLGFILDSNFKQECRDNPRAEALLEQLVRRIYPIEPEDGNISVDVHVVKDGAVNAYATLGGNIYINSALLKQAESPEELAGVLAHEITHVQHRHIMEGTLAHLLTTQGINAMFGTSSAAQWANYFVRMDFTRGQETEADEGGLKRLQEAHVDNSGFKSFFERMQDSGLASQFLSDHPSNLARIHMVEKFANRNVTPIMTPEEWRVLKAYCE